jgi:transglutaminase-like putative cysteine protease
MTKYIFLLIFVLSFGTTEIFSQYILPFGDIKLDELSNKPYKPDMGADAVILSDIGVATLNYNNGFYVELERDVRIRIVNTNGFDYADIEIPFSTGDKISFYRASTFNTRNGVKSETKIPKKSFIIENTSMFYKALKFNFPDVHEGSVIEYSYIIRLKSSINTLVPWKFQSDIPTAYSSVTISYPEAFSYKSIISGSASNIRSSDSKAESIFLGERVNILTGKWYTRNMPAFREEPYIKSKKEHITKLSFELGSINFPGSYYEEITPTYSSLTTKLLVRNDFGKAINTNLRSVAEKITLGQTDNLAKLKIIHEYISNNILWNGEKDFTASGRLFSILKKQKGNSADINMLLIAMLRSLSITADPVILSTRSNGSLNQYSAMIQQFDYLVAYVTIDGDFYLVDATDPLRPFNMLPFDCLNDAGRLISQNKSNFIALKNREKYNTSIYFDLILDEGGNISGRMENKYSDYSAYNIRKLIKLKSEEGYADIKKSLSGNMILSDFKVENPIDPYADLIEKCNVNIAEGAQLADNEIIFNPSFSIAETKNPFVSADREFPVDFGCPFIWSYTLNVKIPSGYSITEMPSDISLNNGGTDLKFDYNCSRSGNEILIKSVLNINKTLFLPSEYSSLRNFYSKMLEKQSELIVLKKNSAI